MSRGLGPAGKCVPQVFLGGHVRFAGFISETVQTLHLEQFQCNNEGIGGTAKQAVAT